MKQFKPVYLYLNEKSHVDTWVNGGEIPLFMASKYKSEDRKGIMTPDELTQRKYDGVIDQKSFHELFIIPPENTNSIDNLTLIKDGKMIAKNMHFEQYQEDNLIFCASTELSTKIALDLKKMFCVEILNLNLLKSIFDFQLKEKGIMKECSYTQENSRNHFLKSIEDIWQSEIRIIWKYSKSAIDITIPKGVCKEIDLNNL